MAEAEDGIIMETEMSFKKKTMVSRNWIALDSKVQGIILDLDNIDIMKRVEINARDLRILDPLLSYPSVILGRGKAIVLNLESIIRCGGAVDDNMANIKYAQWWSCLIS